MELLKLACWNENNQMLTCLVILLLVWYLFKHNTREAIESYPKGPLGLPILGYLPFMGSNPGKSFMDMKKKYGPVMSITLGSQNWIVLNDYEIIIQALVKQGDKFSGRPRSIFIDKLTNGGYGLIFSDYDQRWKRLRKFCHSNLRAIGVGKKSMEEKVNEESAMLLQNLTSHVGGDLKMKISMAVTNIMSKIILGHPFSYDDQKFIKIVSILRRSSDPYVGKVIGLVMFCPVLRHLPVINNIISEHLRQYQCLLQIIKESIEDHKASYDDNNIRKDFIDAFLREINMKGENDAIFCEDNFLQCIRDFLDAGQTNTSSILLWSIFALAHFQDFQEKMAEEIRNVLGESGIPGMQHRNSLPLTCAFIHEIMRLKSIGPLAFFHEVTEDCTLRGYKIDKNTPVISNMWSVHHDPDIFPDPDSFRPDRFINEEGNFVRSRHVIPFSVGPRYCLGESLARTEIFIFLTNIVQKLHIIPDPSNPLPPFNDGIFNGVTYESLDYNVIFQWR